MFNKKYLAIILALVLLAGCSSNNVKSDDVESSVINTGQYSEEQSGMGQVIDEKINTIVNKPGIVQLSSNPYDYIKEDKNYDDILKLGNDAFRYMLKRLENSQENGLHEYIMAMACSDMLGEDSTNKAWSTGKGWYEGYMAKSKEGRSGGSAQEKLAQISAEFAYPSTWPKLEILNDNNRVYWYVGDANFTGEAGGRVGNTYFGMNEEHVDKLIVNTVTPEAKLVFKAMEVQGLNKPQLNLYELNKDNSSSVYPLNQNTMIVPKEDGEYTFILSVDWGKGDNNIVYWFKLRVKAA